MYRTTRREDNEDNVIRIERQKPRARELNETLMRRKGGPMKNPKDVSRSKDKQALRRGDYNLED